MERMLRRCDIEPDIITISAKLQKSRYVDDIPTLAKVQIS